MVSFNSEIYFGNVSFNFIFVILMQDCPATPITPFVNMSSLKYSPESQWNEDFNKKIWVHEKN